MDLFQLEDVDIRLEILSNWGHASRVGLTEIQLLQSSGALLPVPSSGVSVRGAHAQSGPPSILFNGKAKVRGGTGHRPFFSLFLFCKWGIRTIISIKFLDCLLCVCW